MLGGVDAFLEQRSLHEIEIAAHGSNVRTKGVAGGVRATLRRGQVRAGEQVAGRTAAGSWGASDPQLRLSLDC